MDILRLNGTKNYLLGLTWWSQPEDPAQPNPIRLDLFLELPWVGLGWRFLNLSRSIRLKRLRTPPTWSMHTHWAFLRKLSVIIFVTLLFHLKVGTVLKRILTQKPQIPIIKIETCILTLRRKNSLMKLVASDKFSLRLFLWNFFCKDSFLCFLVFL